MVYARTDEERDETETELLRKHEHYIRYEQASASGVLQSKPAVVQENGMSSRQTAANVAAGGPGKRARGPNAR